MSDSDIFALPSYTVNCLAHAVAHLAGFRNFSLGVQRHGTVSVFPDVASWYDARARFFLFCGFQVKIQSLTLDSVSK